MNPRPAPPEALENRIAPAGLLAVSLDGKTATWTDVDGDTVTLKASKGVLDAKDFTFIAQQAGEVGQQLALLDLSDAGAAGNGVSLTFTAKRTGKLGDGSVNIGRIDATGVDLGAVRISGDLASIAAGDATLATPAVGSLTVTSAGALGGSTQGAGAVLDWAFTGKIGAVTVKGDFFATLNVRDGTAASAFNSKLTTGPITIWGDLVGGSDALSGLADVGTGYIFSQGNMGAVKISGEIFGGSAQFGGFVSSLGSIPSVTVGGNVFGGSASNTGEISGVLGTVKIGGTLYGGSAPDSGVVTSFGAMSSVTVNGSVVGGRETNTGSILAFGPLGKVTIGGSVAGGDSPRDQDGFLFVQDGDPFVIRNSGAIGSFLRIDSVTIRGDLVAGEGQFSGAIFTTTDPASLSAGALATAGNIKSVTIGGTLQGFSFIDDGGGNFLHVSTGIYSDGQLGAVKVGAIAGTDPLDPAAIVALGRANPANASQALAIASITVQRGVASAEILAGFNFNGIALNPDVQIGAVKVGNGFIGSSISAGVPFTGDGFGDVGNAITAPGTGFTDKPAILSRIASLTVGGYVLGNPFAAAGFLNGAVAQDIGVMKIGTAVIELTPGAVLDVEPLGVNRSFIVREVA